MKNIDTLLVKLGRDSLEEFGAVNPPIVRASTILQPTLEAWEDANKPEFTGIKYGRKETQVTNAFQDAMSKLYGCDSCVAVCSGVASISISILSIVSSGDHILVTDSVFGPTRKFCDQVLPQFGISVDYYDPLIGQDIISLMNPDTALIFVESPSSLTFEMQDIPAIVTVAKENDVKVIMDNTWGTALHFNPFDSGVDIVVEAATKYVSGHSDVLMGLILGNGELGRNVYHKAKVMGMCCSPDDLYIALRGLRTLSLRLKQSNENGLAVSKWLQVRPEVKKVFHPALSSDEGHEIWLRDFSGSCGLFSVLLEPLSRAALNAFYNDLKLFGIGASWGGFESLIMPIDISGIRTAVPWVESGHLFRLYTGLEDPLDMIRDLERGFERIEKIDDSHNPRF